MVFVPNFSFYGKLIILEITHPFTIFPSSKTRLLKKLPGLTWTPNLKLIVITTFYLKFTNQKLMSNIFWISATSLDSLCSFYVWITIGLEILMANKLNEFCYINICCFWGPHQCQSESDYIQSPHSTISISNIISYITQSSILTILL